MISSSRSPSTCSPPVRRLSSSVLSLFLDDRITQWGIGD
ncbi:hypothetical protein LINGRAHAP2_LOCUS4767 [Linum grandiflorum]